ncbi:protein MpPP2C_N [Marchantia polymorpha subsp. ruderalis]|uniref:protein-serine/threonine phosphatase n=2 Tax=Marchantia polymorpha TaxID=3197 RepID=A0AAF6BVH8_MARPO|nr:hypothetical protein MARPO_0088s0007 [Marchantia polymorpha]BBN16012.1 hypothetical protein Mp_7g02800 [Marchantia polymorpha subsp. ruderalis]|eukprot:PTQ33458.1 hypothetical protein MARPO_0088s0007 [Marchantia polymorpha]
MAMVNAAMTLNLQAGMPLKNSSVRASRLASVKKCVEFEVGNIQNRGASARKGVVRCALVLTERYGALAVKGTGRPNMEDTLSIVVDPKGKEPAFFGVFDGHGGIAVADLLKTGFWPVYKNQLSGSDPVRATESAYYEFDQLTLAQPKGLFGGMRERGVGGSRCGATAATVVLKQSEDGQQKIIAANVGDARVVLARGGNAIQLTFDHKPDVEEERKRIEKKNPVPKKPLVVNVDGTWRVGGLLALSRAFGDVYLKDWTDGKLDGARGGFGLTAEPHVTVKTLLPEDELIILATDGLWEKISNQEVVDFCTSAGKEQPLDTTIKGLIKLAQDRGTTDDISIVIVRLS